MTSRRSTGDDTHSRTLSRLAAEDIVRNFRTRATGTFAIESVAEPGTRENGSVRMSPAGRRVPPPVSGTRDDPEINFELQRLKGQLDASLALRPTHEPADEGTLTS